MQTVSEYIGPQSFKRSVLLTLLLTFLFTSLASPALAAPPSAKAKLVAEMHRLLDDLQEQVGHRCNHVSLLRKKLGLLARDGEEPTPVTQADYDQAYQACESLSGEALSSTLKNLIDDHNSISYREARKILFLELDNESGRIECVYTGRTMDVSSMPDPANMNTEHTWPQSLGATGVAKSDLHHLFITDSRANSRRSSLPFGEVSDASWTQGGSECDGRCFEVRPENRGNTARAIFYFSVRYGKSIAAKQEAALRRWHAQDPVDTAERTRNDGVFAVQHNRNPFVDRPQFIAKIADF